MAGHRATEIENLDMKWHVLKLLIPYLLEFRGRISVAFACLVMAKVASLSLPYFLKFIVDDLDNQLSNQIANTDILVIVPLVFVLAYGFARFLNVIFNELRDTLFGRVTERTIRRISLKTFQHLHSLDLDFHLNRRTGGISRDVERGTSGINFLLRFMIFNIIPTLLEFIIVMIIFLKDYDISFVIIIFSAIITYSIYTIIMTERRTRFVREMNNADSATSTRSIDSLLNYETVKYFTNEKYESDHYDIELSNWESAKRKNRLSLFALNGGQAFIVAVSMTAMLTLAANGVATGVMTLGDFVFVNTIMMQLFIPLNFLGFVYREIKGALANIEKLFDLLAVKTSIIDPEEPKELAEVKPKVEFKAVNFSYGPDRIILSDINFTITPGEKVAVVGASGSGKSTLVKLLFRFYDCNSGSVEIGGVNVKDLKLSTLRKEIGIVPQDTVLFNDTIFENIHYGRPQASDEEVMEVIKLAHLDEFIKQLPEGSNTLVGERGLKLSGGEKQRVAIARTMLKRPSILVFDEATSSLDSKTEKAILTAMKEVSEGYTSLVIAHRLSTIVDADKIIVLDKGQIVEAGDHLSLLKTEGVYHSLWQVQLEKESALVISV